MKEAEKLAPCVGVTVALFAMGLSVATFYRRRAGKAGTRKAPASHRALSTQERQHVLDVLRSPRFVDRSPGEVYATLLEQDDYLCSERTMYRILAANQEVRERRNQLRHPKYVKPEIVATAPNQAWSWDITKLRTFAKFVYVYLYVMLDIYSRYVVGWMLAEHENAAFAQRLIEETCRKHDVHPKELILHSDRGSPMRSKTVAQLLGELDVRQSFSRPHVSNDNPFSESHFKTVKYHPDFPGRFGGIEHARSHFRSFFPWYNDEHHHSRLRYLTPQQVHYGMADDLLLRRHATMLRAYERQPERFPAGPPKPQRLPAAVWINPPDSKDAAAAAASAPPGADVGDTRHASVTAQSRVACDERSELALYGAVRAWPLDPAATEEELQ